MKIQFASDLHLEFAENSNWLRRNPLIPLGDILLLAGDICYLGDEMYVSHPFWDWCSQNFEQTFIIPGNHELYKGFNINSLVDGWEFAVRHNVKVIYNRVLNFGNIDIIASTLWARINPAEAYFTEHCVSDFRRIRNGEHLLTWDRFNDEHLHCIDFIKKAVQQSQAQKRIILTHHVPSFDLMSDEFNGSMINGAFTSNLNVLIESLPIDYWIYGHSHRNIEKVIAGTIMLSNQLGYVFAGEHTTFQPDRYIDL